MRHRRRRLRLLRPPPRAALDRILRLAAVPRCDGRARVGRYAVGEEPVLPEPGEATGASATAKRALERRNSNIVLSTPEATTAALAGMSSDGFKKSDGFGSKASSTPSPSKKKGKDIDIVVPVLHTVLVKAVQDNAAGGVEIDATCIQRCLLDGLPPSIQKMIKEQEVTLLMGLEPCSLLLCVCVLPDERSSLSLPVWIG